MEDDILTNRQIAALLIANGAMSAGAIPRTQDAEDKMTASCYRFADKILAFQGTAENGYLQGNTNNQEQEQERQGEAEDAQTGTGSADQAGADSQG